jgi:hypothetical protein
MAGHRRESSVPLLLLAAALLLLGSRGSCSGAGAARADTVIDVRQMGAKGDGVANDTAPIAAAFAAAASASAAGGTVTVRLPGPAVYMVDRPLSFAANHSLLSIEAGAVLRYHWDPDKILSFYDWPSYAVMLTVGPPSGSGRLVNVSLGGGGIVDGQGFMHWPYVYHYRGKHGRPYMFAVHGIDQLVIEDLTLLNPPMITFNGPCGCNDVVMRHLNLTAAWLLPDEFYNPKHSPLFPQWRHTAPTFSDGAPTMNGTCGHERGGSRIWADEPTKNYCEPANTDGIDPGCGSRNVHIHDVFIENGDDSVVMKPGWGKERPAGCTRDILVENVTIFRGMGANIGGLGSGCVVSFVPLLQPPHFRCSQLFSDLETAEKCCQPLSLNRGAVACTNNRTT